MYKFICVAFAVLALALSAEAEAATTISGTVGDDEPFALEFALPESGHQQTFHLSITNPLDPRGTLISIFYYNDLILDHSGHSDGAGEKKHCLVVQTNSCKFSFGSDFAERDKLHAASYIQSSPNDIWIHVKNPRLQTFDNFLYRSSEFKFGRGELESLGMIGGGTWTFTAFDATPVPAPPTWILLLLGFGSAGAVVRQLRRQAATRSAAFCG